MKLTATQQKIINLMRRDPESFIWHPFNRSSGQPYLTGATEKPIKIQYRTLDTLVEIRLIEETDLEEIDCIYRLRKE